MLSLRELTFFQNAQNIDDAKLTNCFYSRTCLSCFFRVPGSIDYSMQTPELGPGTIDFRFFAPFRGAVGVSLLFWHYANIYRHSFTAQAGVERKRRNLALLKHQSVLCLTRPFDKIPDIAVAPQG